MGIPRHPARFITPQPRNWNSGRGGRGYDNRRRQQYYSESPNFKYRPQFYVEGEEEEEEEEGALMTAKEKDWLIRIQLMQLTTDKPELDDYYYHTFDKRRLAKERVLRESGVERESQQMDRNIEMGLPHVNKRDYSYKPAKFVGSLGQVSVGSVYHPREIVQVGDTGKPRGPVGSSKETKKKYLLLLTIEKGFDQILPIEDLERLVLQMPQDVRPQLYDRRDKLFQRCFGLLNLKTSKDSNKKYDDDMLLQMLSVRKGRRLLSKMLRILNEVQRHEIALAITRNLRTMTRKDIHTEEKDSLCEALVDIVRGSPSGRVVEHYKNIVLQQDSSVFLSSKFTLRVVIELMKRILELAKNIDAGSLPLQSLWPDFLTLIVRGFVTASPKMLAKNYPDVQNLVLMLNDNADESRISSIQEQFRLVENARPTSPQR